MKKYFCFSDCHGFYDILKNNLDKKGFDINNPEHILIVCGDIFDRGDQPLEVYTFLKSLPKERRILIRGNHEYLLRDLVNRGYPESYDYHNGTIDTLFQLHGYKGDSDFKHQYFKEQIIQHIEYGTLEYENYRTKWLNKIKKIYKGVTKEILDWIFSDEWVNYYETDSYIFVHSWIPLAYEKREEFGFNYKDNPQYREDWKNATEVEWEDATWGCPWGKAKMKLNQTNKTIVCGHWHTSDFFNNLTKQHKDRYDCPIFKSKKYKLIGLDACTVASHKINILLLNEGEL